MEDALDSHKINLILNKLTQNQLPIQQLALLTKIRQILAIGDTCKTDYKAVMAETNIMQTISTVFSLRDDVGGADANGNSYHRLMKLEAGWIITNLGFGDSQVHEEIFNDKYGVINHINLILSSTDVMMIE